MTTYLHKLFFLGFWFLWAAIHALALSEWGYSPQQAWADSLVSNGWLAIACATISSCLRYYLPRKDRLLYLLLMSVVVAVTWSIAARYTIAFFANETTVRHFNETLYFRVAVSWLMIICVVMINVLRHNQEEQKEQERLNNEADRIAKDAELFKLRQQLQPHFLFNSLNSISALVTSDPVAARTMVHQLSDYLRSTLKKEERKWVTLSEELEYLKLYLAIEKVRFGDRLSVLIDSTHQNTAVKIPALLLQPVVENAIKFGLYDIAGDVCIRVSASVAEKTLTIMVENPFDPDLAKPEGGTGFGLSSVQRRLQLLFGRTDLLHTATKGPIFTTTIKVPQS